MPHARTEISQHAPRMMTFKINPEKIGALIGPGLIIQALIWIALLGGVGAAESVYWHAWRNRTRRSAMARSDSIPHAPSIVGGVWLTLWAN